MFERIDFTVPARHPTACVDDEGTVPPEPFDLLLALLPTSYQAGVLALVNEGFLDAYLASGRHWIKRADLEDWLRDDGHSTFDPTDPAYIAPNMVINHDQFARRRQLQEL